MIRPALLQLARAFRVALPALVLLCGGALPAFGQALSPSEALQRFKVAEGFHVELFASEPLIRQPVTMTFDDRGRMWVIQYLQYPTPAGLKPVEVDRYLRTKYDRVPEPPPAGPKGADRITILEDTDGDGHADLAKDFVGGLNLASALAIGNGGVYVGQAPYLLFYPDRNRDDVPDGDPEVLLTGFGLEDAHAVMNSLQWGPDGWLYGAQGSTVTADIRGIGFQQGLWRYHPATRRFELFSEGGGNTWGLDFDRHGNAIAGTNFGDKLCLHQVQGAYYVKGFAKHGPLHNPYAFGYFEHCTHQGLAGGHVTCGGIVYQGGAWPKEFENTYVAANLLSNAVYYSALEPVGSTFKTRYLGTLLETDDPWFRPIDCLTGPDGQVYVADWYDQRANHVIPEDTWDRSNGRIWKIVHGASPVDKAAKIDLAARSSESLAELLAHQNAWYRREARRILAERRDPVVLPQLRKMIESGSEPQALEALWTLYLAGGWDDQTSLAMLDHKSADVRAWSVRLIGDALGGLPQELQQRLVRVAESEPSVTVRSQLACTCKRLRGADALPIVARLFKHNADAGDPHLPLLLWWAIENKAISDRDAVLALVAGNAWSQPIVQGTIVERLARRYLAEKSDAGYDACGRLLALAPSNDEARRLALAMDQDLSGAPLEQVPKPLVAALTKLWADNPSDPKIMRLILRLGSREAYQRALERIKDPQESNEARLALIAPIGQAARPDARELLLSLAEGSEPAGDPVRTAALAALGNYGDEAIAGELLSRHARFTPAARKAAIATLSRRASWSKALLEAVAAGSVKPDEVSVDELRQMLTYDDASLASAIEARYGKVRAATPGEKMSYVPVLGRVLAAGQGDLESGHKLFTKHCATCHTLHGEGGRVGPDLTAADRKNRDALLLNILDPSGTIRPEYVSHTIVMLDGHVLTGLVLETTPRWVTIVDAKAEKVMVARDQIEELKPSATSLMPERLLETLQPQELRDLFRYLQSDAPSNRSAAKP